MSLIKKQMLPFHTALIKISTPCPWELQSLLPFQQHYVFSTERMFEGAVIRLDRNVMYWRPNADLILYLHWWYMLILDFPNWVWHLYWHICKIERNALHEIWKHGRADGSFLYWCNMILEELVTTRPNI